MKSIDKGDLAWL